MRVGAVQSRHARARSMRTTVARRPCRPRGADADQSPHEQTQVEATGVHEHALQDVGVTPQMDAAQRARLVQMRPGAFQPLAPVAQQASATLPADAPAIPNGVAGRGLPKGGAAAELPPAGAPDTGCSRPGKCTPEK